MLQLKSINKSFQHINTNSTLQLIKQNKINKIKLINNNQHINLTLHKNKSFTNNNIKNTTHIQTFYITPHNNQIISIINSTSNTNKLPNNFNNNNPQPN